MAYQKTGYQDSLEFDPDKGIIKFGNYEFFADQVGAGPKTTTFNIDDYKNSVGYVPGASSVNGGDAELRKQFQDDVTSGRVVVNENAKNPVANVLYPGAKPYTIKPSTPMVDATIPKMYKQSANNPNIKVLDNGDIESTSYEIPKTLDFVNMLSAKATQISNAASQGQVSDSSRPNPSNKRLGKANLSRAGTVLTEGALAGSPSTLGASTTALGS